MKCSFLFLLLSFTIICQAQTDISISDRYLDSSKVSVGAFGEFTLNSPVLTNELFGKFIYGGFIDSTLKNGISGRLLASSITLTLGIWGLGVFNTYLLMRCYPLHVEVTIGHAFILLICVTLGLSMPNAPGFLGSFHLAVVLGLLLGMPTIDIDRAVTFAILFHLALLVPTLLAGYALVWIDGLHIRPEAKPESVG